MTPPNDAQIDETFEFIQDRLEDPRMKLIANEQVKTGYEAALDILDGTKAMIDINAIKGVQASAIAVLAVDYLTGHCTQEVLVCVPLKGPLDKAYKNELIERLTNHTINTQQAEEMLEYFGWVPYKVAKMISIAKNSGKSIYEHFELVKQVHQGYVKAINN